MSLLMRRSLPCGTLAFRRACHPSLSPAFNRCAPLCLRQTVRPAGRFFTAPRPTEPSEAPPTDASAAATGAEAVGEGSAPSGGKATVCGKYGAIGVAIYLGIYAGTFGMCYLLLSSGVLQEDHVETIAQWCLPPSCAFAPACPSDGPQHPPTVPTFRSVSRLPSLSFCQRPGAHAVHARCIAWRSLFLYSVFCCRVLHPQGRARGAFCTPPPRTGIPYFPYSPEQWPVQWVLRTIAQK